MASLPTRGTPPTGRGDRQRHLLARSSTRAASRRFLSLSDNVGNDRSSRSIERVMMPATSVRVTHLLSAGITHHGAWFVLVFWIICSNAVWYSDQNFRSSRSLTEN